MQISIADLCIALISFSGSGSANLTRKSKLVLQAAFRLRRIPHKAIISLPSVCPGNEVQNKLLFFSSVG